MTNSRRSFGLLALAGAICFSDSVRVGALAPPRPNKEIRSMIDALANRNPEPEVIGRGEVAIPLFAEDYDWDEEKRSRRAFAAIRRDDREDVWEEFLNHLDDKRYAGTALVNGASVQKKTVGGVCRLLASDRLWSPFERDLPVHDLGRPIVPKLEMDTNLAQWRKERAEKSLYELQIEACESAIMGVKIEGHVRGVPDPAIRESCAKIQERVKQLRREKRPFFRPLALDSYHWYAKEEAERIRKRLDGEGAIPAKSPR